MEEHLPEHGYDSIICLGNSFPHLLDNYGDQREHHVAITQFYSLLKPGGILLIDHRNFDSMLSQGNASKNNIYYDVRYLNIIKQDKLFAMVTVLTLFKLLCFV